MAKQTAKQKNTGADYTDQLNKLKIHGAQRLYLLWGEEDYLRERFVETLRNAVLGEGEDDFNYKRMDGRSTEIRDIEEAVNSVPFMGERSFLELRDLDLNGLKEEKSQHLAEILSDIPDYCTVALVQDIDFAPDGRRSLIKTIKKYGQVLEFVAQGQSAVVRWIGRRFKELGKEISRSDAEYLIFVSGSLMNQLIPEIEKLAGYVKGDTVTRKDIDAVAIKLPEANVFEMTDYLSEGNYDAAAGKLSELLLSREAPIKILSFISQQMRRLYAAKLIAPDGKGDVDELCEICALKYRFMAENLIKSARKLSLGWLIFACEICTEYDYKMKSASTDDDELLKELLARLAVGV